MQIRGSSTRLSTIILALVVAFLTANIRAAAQTEAVLYSFGSGDSTSPNSMVTLDGAGNLYGTTMFGTVWQLSQQGGVWTENILYDFHGPSNYSTGGLILDAQGNVYGTTVFGGTAGGGSVFELSPQSSGGWSLQTLHSFGALSAGLYPQEGLVFDSAGNIYGTTNQGGTTNTNCLNPGCGVVFELRNTSGGWKEQVLHTFGNGTDGQFPGSKLILDSAGNLYGTTLAGGSATQGTVFELVHGSGGTWKERILHTFRGGKDGSFPFSNLIFDASGNLYGVTAYGGTYKNGGTVYELSPQTSGSWTYKILYDFGRSGDGAQPFGNIVFDSVGNLYGANDGGGANKVGAVFELSPQADGSWTETLLHSFGSGTDGLYAEKGVNIDPAGNLYGTADSGGTNGDGIVFEITR
jgi:uncharacterized repeat protein (TIGR03803 family)